MDELKIPVTRDGMQIGWATHVEGDRYSLTFFPGAVPISTGDKPNLSIYSKKEEDNAL